MGRFALYFAFLLKHSFFIILIHLSVGTALKNGYVSDTGNREEGLFSVDPDLFLTISSEPDCPKRAWYKPWTWFTETKCDRRLELNWINFDRIFVEDNHVEDYVGVFQWDPASKSSPQPPPTPQNEHMCPVKSRSEAASGYCKTTLRYEKPTGNLSSEAVENPCFLGYWIAYVRTIRKLNDSSNDSLDSSWFSPQSDSRGVSSTVGVVKSKCLRLYPCWMAELKKTIGDLPLTSLLIPGTHNSGSWEPYQGLLQSEINPLSTYEIT